MSVTFDLSLKHPCLTMEWMLYIALGLLAGLVVGWFLAKRGQGDALRTQSEEHARALQALEQQGEHQRSAHAQQVEDLRKTAHDRETKLGADLTQAQERINTLTASGSKLETELTALREKLEERQKDLEQTRQELTQQFKIMSTGILDQQSAKFSEQNKQQIDGLLAPLKEKISSFEKAVEEKYVGESKDRADLKAQIRNMMEQSAKLSSEAHHLANALKGDNKAQGNWGEMVLTRVLESSGLRQGQEFVLQYSEQDDELRRKQPDVIINLPDNRHIIVDSKVSLVAYESVVNAEDEDQRQQAIKNHLLSVRGHVKNLSGKDYPSLTGLNAPDFVLLFVPIEASFAVAIEQDQDLFDYAWKQKIVIVTPSTLLATLRTVASVWQHERRIQNATDIAEEAGRMLDKFKDFTKDMEGIGNRLQQAQKTYDDAMNKLSTGRGNLVKRATDLEKKGVTSKKAFSDQLLQNNDPANLPADADA